MLQAVPAQFHYLVPAELKVRGGGVVFVRHIGIPAAAVIRIQADRNTEAQIFGERVLGSVRHVFQQAVGYQIDLHQIRAVAHQQHRVRVKNQIHAVPDAGGTQQQGVAHFMAGAVLLARVDGQRNVTVGAAHFAKSVEKPQSVAFVVIFTARHIDAHPSVAMGGDPGIHRFQTLRGVRSEPQNHALKAQCNPGSQSVWLVQAFRNNAVRGFGRKRLPVGVDKAADARLRFDVADALRTEEAHIFHHDVAIEPGVVHEVAEARYDALKEFVTRFTRLIQNQ